MYFCLYDLFLSLKHNSYSAAIAHLTIDTMDTQIEHQALQDIEYSLEYRIQTAESELSKMKR